MASAEPAIRVGIIGVSGYSGMELARLLVGHPRFTLAAAISDKWAGAKVGERLPFGGPTAAVRVRPQAEAAQAMSGLDLVFLCTPAEASLELAGPALEAGARVVDLSGALRLPADEYPRWYGFTHPRPELLKQACYAMPEAVITGDIRQARLVSNPGCYATASTLATLALLRGGVIAKEGIVIDAKSGMTGAGRKATEEMSFSEIDGDFRAYKVLKHQHTPEIERTLALAQPSVGDAARDVHAVLPADPARHPGDGLRAAPARQDRRRRGGRRQGVRGRPAVLAGDHARRGPAVGDRRDEPRPDGGRRRPRARCGRSRSPPSTTWSRGPPGKRSRTPT